MATPENTRAHNEPNLSPDAQQPGVQDRDGAWRRTQLTATAALQRTQLAAHHVHPQEVAEEEASFTHGRSHG